MVCANAKERLKGLFARDIVVLVRREIPGPSLPTRSCADVPHSLVNV